jgi:hypothetical protein
VSEVLGTILNGEDLATELTDKRYVRLHGALRFSLYNCARLSGIEVGILLGHCTFAGLVRRENLAIFHTVYVFIRKHYEVAVPLWTSVREELTVFLRILPLLRASWRQPWRGQVYSYDASLKGGSVAVSKWSEKNVSKVVRLIERSRYRLCAVCPPKRDVAL